jgi:hypothetical protein
MRKGAELTVFDKKQDALRHPLGLSLAKARELIQRGHAELVSGTLPPEGEFTS